MTKPSMFFGASGHIFEKAKELRHHMTPSEMKLWEHLKKNQLEDYRFRRQHPISEFIADFYCHKAKLVVEVDGGIHKMKEQKLYDIDRSTELTKFGIKVIRVTNDQIEKDIDRVLNEIKLHLDP